MARIVLIFSYQEIVMALQIQRPEILRLVEELARRTGEGVETTVAVAVRERLELHHEVEN
jgi:hypothetical protein